MEFYFNLSPAALRNISIQMKRRHQPEREREKLCVHFYDACNAHNFPSIFQIWMVDFILFGFFEMKNKNLLSASLNIWIDFVEFHNENVNNEENEKKRRNCILKTISIRNVL